MGSYFYSSDQEEAHLQELFGGLEELADDDEPVDEAVVPLEDQVLLELPRLRLLLALGPI
jgi:hypothetical protein